jgi:hypothetical protein
MDNNNNVQNINNGMPALGPNGQEGTWVPVDPGTLPFTVGGSPNQPVQGPDGAYYCVAQASPDFAPIAANQYNAIPTPSQIVQLPAIVQPIALVPYTSQNQPMLQYDPGYKPEVPMGNTADPVYRAKPYSAISVLLALFAVVSIVAMCVLTCLKGAAGMTGIDTIFALPAKFGVEMLESVYYTEMFALLGEGTEILLTIIVWAIPVIFALLIVFAAILTVKYLIRLGGRKSPRCFSILALIGLILSAAVLAVTVLSNPLIGYTLEAGIGLYIVVAAYLLLFIFPFFAKKGAVAVDLEASKRVYTYR